MIHVDKSHALPVFILTLSILSQLIMRMSIDNADGSQLPLLPGNQAEQYIQHNGNTPNKSPDRLRFLIQEHTSLTSTMYINALENRNDFKASKIAVDLNTRLLSREIEHLYGTDVRENFDVLWQSQISLLTTYAKIRDTDPVMEQKIDDALTDYVDLSARLMSLKKPENAQQVRKILVQHVQLQKEIIDSQSQGNTHISYVTRHTAIENAIQLADIMWSQSD